MGNAVISGILFQPPSPPIALPEILGPNDKARQDSNTGNGANSAQTPPPIRKRSNNISIDYLWLYSADDYGVTRLIPSIHIRHTDIGQTNANIGGNSKRYTLLYSHGNAEDLGLISSFLVDLARLLQVNVLCYDYSGYGASADERSVFEFFKGYEREIAAWRRQRANGDRSGYVRMCGDGCRYTRDMFVAPMIRPTATNNAVQGTEVVEKKEEDDEGSYDFTNACSLPGEESDANDPSEKRRRNLLSQHSWSVPSPSESNCYANINSAYDYLTKVEGVQPKHVILYGKSVGSGPTCWLAQRLCQGGSSEGDFIGWDADSMCNVESREPTQGAQRGEGEGSGKSADAPGGVVLHSPFLSVIRVVLDVGFTTIGDLFPNIDRVGDFTCPVYVIHGSNDGIVPFYHGQTLFQGLPDQSKTVPFWARGAGHNNIEMDMPTAYVKRLQQFVRQCDRLNYPLKPSGRKAAQQQQQTMLQASLQASLRQSMHQQEKAGGARPVLHRYASQDSYHLAKMAQAGVGSRPSKQRKQKGTLVQKGMLPPPPPPPGSPPNMNTRQPQQPRRSNWAHPASASPQGVSTQELDLAMRPGHPQKGQWQQWQGGIQVARQYNRSMSASVVSDRSHLELSGRVPPQRQLPLQLRSQQQQYR